MALGAVAVPCNGWWSGEEMAHACTLVDPSVIVCDERRADRVPPDRRTLSTEGLACTGSGRSDGAVLLLLDPGRDRFTWV